MWTVAGFLALVIAASVIQEYRISRPQKSDVAVYVLKPGQDLHLDTATLTPMQLHLFQLNRSRKNVRFMVERTQGSVIHVSLVSCRACYRARDHNYAQKGQMVCGECNGPMPFETRLLATAVNTCALVEIPHKQVGHNLFVSTHDVILLSEGLQQ